MNVDITKEKLADLISKSDRLREKGDSLDDHMNKILEIIEDDSKELLAVAIVGLLGAKKTDEKNEMILTLLRVGLEVAEKKIKKLEVELKENT